MVPIVKVESAEAYKSAVDVCRTLRDRGFQAFIVGGAVRDLLLSRPPHDFDIATNALPSDVISIFEKAVPTGIEFGTVTVVIGGQSIEVTTFRQDGEYKDGRRPSSVVFSSNIENDLARRDFTINAIAYDPIDEKLIDPFGGRLDIVRRVIRAVGNPNDRIQEDALRMLRAIRFFSVLGQDWIIDSSLGCAIARNAANIKYVSIERVRDELSKLICGEHVFAAMQALHSTGLLRIILPDLEVCVGVEQNKHHAYDVFTHILYTMHYIKPSLNLRLAAMLHDIAKPQTMIIDEEGRHFYRHEYLGSIMVDRILRHFRYPNELISDVKNLVANHMFSFDHKASEATVRRLLNRVGIEHIWDQIELRQADQRASKGRVSQLTTRLINMINEELERQKVKPLKLALDGHDVMRLTNLQPGPEVGAILSYLKEVVLDNPDLNTEQALTELVLKYGGIKYEKEKEEVC